VLPSGLKDAHAFDILVFLWSALVWTELNLDLMFL